MPRFNVESWRVVEKVEGRGKKVGATGLHVLPLFSTQFHDSTLADSHRRLAARLRTRSLLRVGTVDSRFHGNDGADGNDVSGRSRNDVVGRKAECEARWGEGPTLGLPEQVTRASS